MYTKEFLKKQLAAMNLLPSDTVVIHTSMKAIGDVEGGADTVIEIFCEYLSDGLFIVPTHTWDNVNAENPVFDASKTVPCIGALPRCAALRGDGYRSLHPTHSIWAHGADAREFVMGEENACTPAPAGGVWSRLGDIGAKILLIGVGNDKNTFIHSIDELADIPDRLNPNCYNTFIIDTDGNRFSGTMCGHLCSKCSDVSRYYVNFERPLTQLGAQTFGKFGNAVVRIVDAAKCRDIIMKIYSRTERDLCTGFMEIPPELYMD